MRVSSLLLAIFASSSIAYTLPLSCAPDGDIMTTPSYGTADAIFTVCAQDTINSPPPPIYDVLIDFQCYGDWNTFVYAVDLPVTVSSANNVYVRMPMTFHTHGLLPVLNSTSNERVTYLEPDAMPPFVAWRYDGGLLGGLFMQAEHVSVLQDLGDGTTKYVSWETYYGAGALLVKSLKTNLKKEFEDQGRDLKARVEGSSS